MNTQRIHTGDCRWVHGQQVGTTKYLVILVGALEKLKDGTPADRAPSIEAVKGEEVDDREVLCEGGVYRNESRKGMVGLDIGGQYKRIQEGEVGEATENAVGERDGPARYVVNVKDKFPKSRGLEALHLQRRNGHDLAVRFLPTSGRVTRGSGEVEGSGNTVESCNQEAADFGHAKDEGWCREHAGSGARDMGKEPSLDERRSPKA